ncbi:deoxyribodipyrimidine photo-lyase [Saccharobesus litoralis]|uniref:Deoxyribodipyrimidine photo-lyase n=1 Tax=Saccharobesus litoralis TaxID=2172099 RepID=A0A2S0VMI0_9ALTE|nr:FAD-binding domain-containing protein [Saccharobesus litoralis]AWB65406.1 deoxyribodipyrimidine photo-lyase [Saccharobesus litoralis]
MLLWFRNDLRLDDNPAFQAALNNNCTQAVFLATSEQWQQHDWAGIKVDFILRHLALLHQQLAEHGIRLDVIEVGNFKGQIDWLNQTAQQQPDLQIVANSEPELNEVQRDKAIINSQLNLTLFESDVIVKKGQILNQQGEMFKVFTPFKRQWLKYVLQNGFEWQASNMSSKSSESSTDNISSNHAPFNNDGSQLESLYQQYRQTVKFPLANSSKWPLADIYTRDILPAFLQGKMAQYADNRDIPSVKGTSGLSPYLAIGAISCRTVLQQILQYYPHILEQDKQAHFSWLNELIWREFYRHLIYHYPKLCRYQNFNDKYDNLAWSNSPELYSAWQQGKTGYPIIDAAMRQLSQTGWMHNRLRMIVASFLTKHCLVDWRHGERHFMRHLIDGDLAANNGGWQWSASTGCDAQPYFRIFNPVSQSKKFDPNGDFIRKYIPELADVPSKEIHFPHKYLAEKNQQDRYWSAIVDLKHAREQALDFYKV